MPTNNASQVVVPARTYIYLAPVGTMAPVDVATDPTSEWIYVGLTTPDSLAFNTEPEFEEVNSGQSDYPVRRFMTSETATVEVDLIQWNEFNLKNVYGGGAVTQASAGVYKFTPPTAGARTERAAIIDVVDGTKRYRYIVPRTMQVEGVSSDLQKGQEARLPLRLAVLGADDVVPWTMLTNDAAFLPIPTISTVSPSTGPAAGGTLVEILGNNFTGATGGTAVKFGAVNATSYTVVDDSKITAVSPAGSAGAVDVVVTTPAGIATSTGGFTYS